MEDGLLLQSPYTDESRGGGWRRRAHLLFYYFAAIFDSLVFLALIPIFHPKCTQAPKFGWHFVHMTTWGGYVQAAYFIVCILDTHLLDRIGREHLESKLHRMRDRFFGFAFGLGTIIGVVYWGILFPVGHQPHDLFLTICEHAVTTFFIWTELFLTPHKYAPVVGGKALLRLLCCASAESYSYHSEANSFDDYEENKFALAAHDEQALSGPFDSSLHDGAAIAARMAVGTHDDSRAFLSEIGPLMMFGAVYVVWNLVCYSINGVYAYSIQGMFPIYAAVFVYASVPFALAAAHISGNHLNSKLWPSASLFRENNTIGMPGNAPATPM